MKIALLPIILLVFASCSQKECLSSFTLENTLLLERVDEPIVLTREHLKPMDNLLPVIIDQKGEYMPCQLDDLDNDGNWDELAFLYSFQPSEIVNLEVRWIEKSKYPQFSPRTNIRYGKLNARQCIEELKTDYHTKDEIPRGINYKEPYPYQMDGPAWENDKMGFRQYFDGRNCRDVFGKRVPDMVLDTVGIYSNGLPGDTYHILQDWGRDIMSAANSFGLGGIALQTPDSLIRMGIPIECVKDVIDSTRYTLVTEGPVRSILRLDYYGWDVIQAKIDVSEEITIWAGKYGYENKVRTTMLPPDSHLVTGIVANNNNESFSEQKHDNRLLSMLTFDKQTYNKEYYMGMALILPLENVEETYHSAKENADIQKTWCVKMKSNHDRIFRYNVYAAWEMGIEKFKERRMFVNLIHHYAECINKPIVIHIK